MLQREGVNDGESLTLCNPLRQFCDIICCWKNVSTTFGKVTNQEFPFLPLPSIVKFQKMTKIWTAPSIYSILLDFGNHPLPL